jgi:hypothetical protein
MKPDIPALLFRIVMRKASVLVVFVLLMLLQVSGCARIMYPKCRHYAIMNTMVFGEHCPVRIAVGLTLGGKWHAQAEAFLGGEWKPLNAAPSAVGTSKQDDFKPNYYVTLGEAMKIWCPKKLRHEGLVSLK